MMISRDGARTSLWQAGTDAYISRNKHTLAQVHDVAIVGGGITGLTLGVLLQLLGKKCVVLEANNIGFGTTGGTTAHLNTILDTPYTTIIKNFGKKNAQLLAQSVRAAIELVKHNIHEYGIDCGFEETPAYLFAQTLDQQQALTDIYEACTDVGVASHFIQTLPIAIPHNKVMLVERQGKFHPLRYVYGLAHAFEDAGGTIVQSCRVQGAIDKAGTVSIETTMGSFKAHALVYATHIPPGVNILHLRCPAYRSYAMAVKLANNNYPDGLIYDMFDPYHYYRTQEIDGENFLIVGGEDHKTGEEINTNGCFLKLESHVRSYFEVSEIVHQWSSQYFDPVDGIPYIGHLPMQPENMYVATGFGGNGITYSHVAALVLKSLLLNEDSIYIDLFNPGRVKPVAGFTEFTKHNADVAKNVIRKLLGKEKLETLADMARGEGKIVQYEGHTLAIYRDEHGGLHAIDPYCQHMGCSVMWNAAERSWDCPCHGARYSVDGKFLTGPANGDLEEIVLRTLIEK
ncbi:MAG: FAD-dependent oxidoreductase [Bacteroidota bacterium]